MHSDLELNCPADIDTDSRTYENSDKYSGYGIEDIHDSTTPIYEDRFLVDRKKLEQLILGDHWRGENAETFFEKVMEETDTEIDWPRRLKIGAKTRKDPYIRIHGNETNVKEAKKKVLSELEPKKSQIIMKMDICYSDHSYIIGRGGLTIQQVMEETGCHIHFPDSNRSNPHEKSNQVSISGSVVGVERARQQLRMLAPVKFTFELPGMSPVHESFPSVSQIIEMVQERYNVHVVLRKGPRLFSDIVLVKGSEEELVKTETATRVLMQRLCHSSDGEVPVQMTMEISPQHHSTVMGFNSSNLKEIMMQTSTVIIFPDAMDPNLPPLKKSTVTISGSIHNVYLAKQRLVGSLPLVLSFSVSEEVDVRIERCNNIMKSLDVIISARLKPKYGTYSVHIRSLERNAGQLYKARQMLLNSNEPPIIAEIPLSYFGQGISLKATGKNNQKLLQRNAQKPFPSSEESNLIKMPENPLDWMKKSPVPEIMTHDLEELNLALEQTENEPVMSIEPGDFGELGFSQNLLRVEVDKFDIYDSSSYEDDNSACSSIISSVFSPTKSPILSTRSGSVNSQGLDSGYGDLYESESSRSASRASLNDCDKEDGTFDEHIQSPMDHENKELIATNAMHDDLNASELSLPKAKWSGFGLSHSMPEYILKSSVLKAQTKSSQQASLHRDKDSSSACLTEDDSDMKMWSKSSVTITDGVTQSAEIDKSEIDLFSLLAKIGMARYSYIFSSNEIDAVTFMTLDEDDLRVLGIPTNVARQKILQAISEVKQNRTPSSMQLRPAREIKFQSAQK
ncbi:protein bicaudal C homolog 1-B-like [Ischnura elegans]|uniref:protein bicaudal C homolog 1-B-like n=1 Tax=Ischnura elegans TaxID=197161 RepID=UPI001ED88F5C|nr:protein bicaudal C homolog 1-B-like [Ischnura elegans]